MDFYVALTSLGCSKNLVDSEIMLGILRNDRFIITKEFSQAQIIVVNTCGFILPAKKESIETILEMASYKKKGRCQLLIVTGCLAEKYREELLKEIPEIDGILGTSEFSQIGDLIQEKLAGMIPKHSGKIQALNPDRYLTTPQHMAYVKIAEGCDNHCTYCLIPQLRGAYRSRPIEEILSEVRLLIAKGVKEINLIAQDSTYYGLDLYGKEKLPELLDTIAQEKIQWIRVLYCYPERITDELLQVMAKHDNICHYLDIPLQHADQNILRRMGRKGSRDSLEKLITHIRTMMPDVALRTTFMVGFPGETEEQFQVLLDFIEKCRFDWLGAFTYSQEEDTPASLFKDQVPEEVKEERYHRLMSLQSKISQQNQSKWVGKTISVIIEGKLSDNPEYYKGRSRYQAPDVDGVVLIKGDTLPEGEIKQVLVTGSDIYDLIGEIIES
ncbi:30S ribosomal protein S12 methylthiotransferase RimO [Dehalobacterium formicoaceticum]|uniref:Ribosomal protein uS12 methylthiotransferase RimO n=1 Tax=Dehalobacterium formicoaceticum TaxID=51515 RepID=A0ABT1Y4W5_9FIRM|nr:30S ribosomal protein S12 methylthiotransferase RimO [Dehalobacterium formicoaceticum]MCR6545916.1 30S ribosomal protein S12 methylthiotransferase RimO [Dehalobacterium formicoaceticum]